MLTPVDFALLIAGLVALTVFSLGAGVRALRQDPELQARLNQYLADEQSLLATMLEQKQPAPFRQRVLGPLLRRVLRTLAWMWPRNRLEELRYRLVLAGNPGGITVGDFIGMKGWTMLLLAGSALLLVQLSPASGGPRAILLVGLLMLLGFFLPDVWLRRRIVERQYQIVKVLPDTLDMLVAAVEAGLSFENALLEITSRWHNTLSIELLRLQRDLGMGVPRRQALLDLARRTGVSDVSTFISAINQAEELGVSMVRVLTLQAEELRIKRRQQAQERANKAPIKMLFPMVFLIFPALFAVLLGPAIPQILRVVGGGR